jgi:RHS repeat-associated protein
VLCPHGHSSTADHNQPSQPSRAKAGRFLKPPAEQGRRVGKKAKVGTAFETVKKRWLYRDGLAPVAEFDSTGAILARYVYGSRPNVPDLVIKGGNVYRLFVDQLGSPRMAVNVANTADVPYRVEYSAFGTATPLGATALDWIPFGFAGGLLDPDTGLVRFGARDYDPVVGRWVSKDPLRFESGDVPNLYLYVNGDGLRLPPRSWRGIRSVTAGRQCQSCHRTIPTEQWAEARP